MGGEAVERKCVTCVHATKRLRDEPCASCNSGRSSWVSAQRAYPTDAETKVDVASAFKAQVGGNHYTKWKIQPFQLSMDNHLDPMQHTIIKYVMRFRDKNGIEDLRKAIHTIQLLAEYEYNERI